MVQSLLYTTGITFEQTKEMTLEEILNHIESTLKLTCKIRVIEYETAN